MKQKIGYIVKNRETLGGGLVKVTIGLVSSDKTGTVEGTDRGRLGANELPYILHGLRSRSDFLTGHQGFDYQFGLTSGDFPLEIGFGFPYVLGFPMTDRPSLT